MMFEIIDDSVQRQKPENIKEVELLIMAQTIAPLNVEEYF